MVDRAEVVWGRMRAEWGARSRFYAEHSAPRNRAFAEALVGLVGVAAGERVLDVAAGPGVVAVAAAEQVGPEGAVLATDLAPEWSEPVAEAAGAAGVWERVAFRAMGAEALDLADGSFDVALCQFGLMFVPDPVRALAEMRRVLRDGGRLGVAVWSTGEKVGHHLIAHLIMTAAPPVPPEERLPNPLDLGEPGLIERHVAAAGFRDVAVTPHTVELAIADAEAEWEARLRGASGNLALALAAIAPAALERVHREAVAALEARRRDGLIRLPSKALLVTAVR